MPRAHLNFSHGVMESTHLLQSKISPKWFIKYAELLLLLTGQLCLRRRTATVVQSTVHTQLAVTVAV